MFRTVLSLISILLFTMNMDAAVSRKHSIRGLEELLSCHQRRSGGDCDGDVGPRVIRFASWVGRIYSRSSAINWEKAGKKNSKLAVETGSGRPRRIPCNLGSRQRSG